MYRSRSGMLSIPAIIGIAYLAVWTCIVFVF